MRSFIHIVVGWCITAMLFSCKKDHDFTPSTTNPVISNLQFSPTSVVIKPNQPTFFVSGTVDFNNASGGVASLRLTSNNGISITVPVPDNSNSQGTLTGTFEFTMPPSPVTINFDVWIVDKKGNASNKMTGAIQVRIDDSGNSWSVISQAWPLDKVVWANNQFMAVGQGGEILNSATGANWTRQQSGVTNALFGIARSASQWMVVGFNSVVLTSPDGINWTKREIGIPNLNLMSVAWSGNLWVATGYEPGDKPVIITSPDGSNWTRNAFTGGYGSVNAVTWADNRFVAVGKDFKPMTVSSADGINWVNKTVSEDILGEFTDIVWSGSRYAAVGFGIVGSSTNGSSWNFAPASNLGLTGITWSGNHFIAVGISGIYRSTDGLSWTKIDDSPYMPRSVAWSGLQYAAVGFVSPILMISPQ